MNIYGKTTEQLKTIIRAHQTILSDYDEADIRKAYLEWLRTKSNMPTPSDIYEIVKEYRNSRSVSGIAMEAREQIAENIKNNHQDKDVVPWYGMTPKEIDEARLRQRLEQHLVELASLKGKDEVENYLKYIRGIE